MNSTYWFTLYHLLGAVLGKIHLLIYLEVHTDNSPGQGKKESWEKYYLWSCASLKFQWYQQASQRAVCIASGCLRSTLRCIATLRRESCSRMENAQRQYFMTLELTFCLTGICIKNYLWFYFGTGQYSAAILQAVVSDHWENGEYLKPFWGVYVCFHTQVYTPFLFLTRSFACLIDVLESCR